MNKLIAAGRPPSIALRNPRLCGQMAEARARPPTDAAGLLENLQVHIEMLRIQMWSESLLSVLSYAQFRSAVDDRNRVVRYGR